MSPLGQCMRLALSFVLLPVLCANGQANRANKNVGVILIDSDDSCHLQIDGEDEGAVKSGEARKISVSFGDHILRCAIEGVPDLVWRKVVGVKNSEQIAVLISLKALHIQYDEANAKLEKGNTNPTASAASANMTPSGRVSSSLRVGDPAPELKISTWDGSTTVHDIQLQDYRGRSVLLAFCGVSFTPESKQTLINLYELKKRHPAIEVLAVTFDSPFVNFAFAQQLGIRDVVLLSDLRGVGSVSFGVLFPKDPRDWKTSSHVNYMIDKNGTVVGVQNGVAAIRARVD